jgi:hypothetical protein
MHVRRAGVALLICVCFTGVTLSRGAPTANSLSTDDYSTDPDLNLTAQLVGEPVKEAFEKDETFGGVRIVPEGLEFSVVAGGSGALVAAIRQVGTKIPTRTRTVQNSWSALEAVSDQVTADQSQWDEKGVPVAMWGPDYDTNRMKVWLSAYSQASEESLLKRYGSDLLIVSKEAENGGPSSRIDDFTPFSGGDTWLRHGTGVVCTSWFTGTSIFSSNKYQFTASHCGSGDWYVGNASGAITGGHPGTTLSNVFSGSVDIQSVSANGYMNVWADPHFATRTVEGKHADVMEGGLVCTDGEEDREVCSVQVQNSDTAVTYSGHTVTHTVHAAQTAGQAAFSPGDSGGPVYVTLSDGGLYAVGMIVYHSSNFSAGNYTKINYNESAMNITIDCTLSIPC